MLITIKLKKPIVDLRTYNALNHSFDTDQMKKKVYR